MKTSPDLSTLSSVELVRRLYKKDQIIVYMALFAICCAIGGLSLGFAIGYTSGYASAQLGRTK